MRAALLGILLLVASAPALAQSGAGNTPPQGPAKVNFPADFPALVDHEWGFAIGGFGGTHRGEVPGHVPAIFVHGNTVDHADWFRCATIFALPAGATRRCGACPTTAWAATTAPSVVNVPQVSTIDRFYLTERVRTLPAHTMNQVDAGLRMVLGL